MLFLMGGRSVPLLQTEQGAGPAALGLGVAHSRVMPNRAAFGFCCGPCGAWCAASRYNDPQVPLSSSVDPRDTSSDRAASRFKVNHAGANRCLELMDGKGHCQGSGHGS